MQLIQRIKMGMEGKDQMLEDSHNNSESRKQEDQCLIKDLKD